MNILSIFLSMAVTIYNLPTNSVSYLCQINPNIYYSDSISSKNIFNFLKDSDFLEKQYEIFGEKYVYTGTSSEIIFKNFNCVKIYLLESSLKSFYLIPNDANWLLVNECDSTAYKFGANTAEFSKVFHNYLNKDMDDSIIVDILQIYLNSRHIGEPFAILKSIDDFETIILNYDDYYPEYIYSGMQKYEDIENVRNNYSPMQIRRKGDECWIRMETWSFLSGDLENWEFVVSNNILYLNDRKLKVEGVGPNSTRF